MTIRHFMSLIGTLADRNCLREFEELRTDIHLAFGYYAILDTNLPTTLSGPPTDLTHAARETYRSLASRLYTYKALPFYKSWLLPSAQNLEIARENLIALSNLTGRPAEALENIKRQGKVRMAIRTIY
jgi:hypothetical protein